MKFHFQSGDHADSSVEDAREYAAGLMEFIRNFRFCFDYHAVDFLLPHSETLPTEWLNAFDNPIGDAADNDDELIRHLIGAVNHGAVPSHWPESMRRYICDAHNISLPRIAGNIQSTGKVPVSSTIGKGVSGKKVHEVQNFAHLIDSFCVDKKELPVCFDLGAGQGYLSASLASLYGFDVCAIDCNDLQTCGCQRRAEDLGIADNNSGSQSAHRGTLMQRTANLTDADQTLQTIQLICNETKRFSSHSRLICSLHACGDLSPTSIRCFVRDPSAKFLFNVACCYNLMTETQWKTDSLRPVTNDPSQGLANCGFPMSTYVWNHADKPWFGQAGKMLASQATSKWGTAQSVEEIKQIFDRHFYRALLQRILFDKGLLNLDHECTSIGVGKMRPKCFVDFPTYMKSAMVRLKQKLDVDVCVNDEEAESYYADYRPRFYQRICGAWSMRAVFSGVIESLILTDRLLYLLEQPDVRYSSIGLLPIFDPIISPRNMLLMAIKR